MYEAGAKSKGEGSHIRMLQCLYHQYGKTFWAIVLGERGHLYRRCREHSGNIYDPVPEIDPALHYGILSWKAYNLPESSHVALLDALREDVLRNADDTPRHTATTKDPVSGISQQRACEDWNKFKAWAMQFGGLWRYLSAAADQRSESERRMYYEPVCLYSVRIQGWVGKYGSTSET
ncbi:hypothetical protein MMC18_007066 [Xylographa bjoerkii]|nr:hypothetical protein [Xylographa bjoerkii]